MEKTYKNFYITYELKKEIADCSRVMGITKSLFIEKAIQIFLAGDRFIDPKLLIKEKKNKDYIGRDALENTRIRMDHFNEIQAIANSYNCSYAIVLYQAIENFCKMI